MNERSFDKRSSLELVAPLLWLAGVAFAAGFGGYLAMAARAAGL